MLIVMTLLPLKVMKTCFIFLVVLESIAMVHKMVDTLIIPVGYWC